MLKDTGFPDLGVVDELKQGAHLVGAVPATGMSPGKFSPTLASISELSDNACRRRSAVESEATGSGDFSIDEIVWSKTLEEVEKGWLEGPIPSEEIPNDCPISRRFGLKQKKDQIRLIDDLTESGVNNCVTTVESPVLHTIDVTCATLAMWFGECNNNGFDPKLVARTFDKCV